MPVRTSCLKAAIGDAKPAREGVLAVDSDTDAGVAGRERAVEGGVIGAELGTVVPEEDKLAGSWYSLRTTARVMCRPFRARRLDAYSKAGFKWGGR